MRCSSRAVYESVGFLHTVSYPKNALDFGYEMLTGCIGRSPHARRTYHTSDVCRCISPSEQHQHLSLENPKVREMTTYLAAPTCITRE